MNTIYTAAGIIHESVFNFKNEERTQPLHDQLNTRPKIDDVICHSLDGDALKEALFIIDNIREHKMKIKWSSVNVWTVQYRRKHVCDIRIENGSLHIGKVSGVLAIRVTNMSYDYESLNRLIESLKNSIAGTQEPSYAFQ